MLVVARETRDRDPVVVVARNVGWRYICLEKDFGSVDAVEYRTPLSSHDPLHWEELPGRSGVGVGFSEVV